ncbi:tripartite tricarboxylate transporter substrate binding protein [Pigmentiphaga soli]|uniref:Tripartite tricarboxylate transporter substrate binding protein n=1 Tax=Pigmentiphaga soli TaxID=1007095 RepID=A0ABP8GTJ2_9BURK
MVPFGAGNSSDVISRIIAGKLSGLLGQQVYVENRVGAGAIIGTEYGARAQPDGYTLVFGSTGPLAISPALQPALVKYDPIKSFIPIATLAWTPQVFVVPADSPYKDIQSLVAAAREKPGQILFGSGGTGTTQHLIMSKFASAAGVKLMHVPYASATAALTDLMAERVAVLSDVLNVVRPQLLSGKIRALGVTPDQRLSQLPDVPTIQEQGVPFNMQSWNIMQVPAGTPPDIVAKLEDAIGRVLEMPDVQKQWNDLGFVRMALPQPRIRDFLLSEMKVWGDVVESSGAKTE